MLSGTLLSFTLSGSASSSAGASFVVAPDDGFFACDKSKTGNHTPCDFTCLDNPLPPEPSISRMPTGNKRPSAALSPRRRMSAIDRSSFAVAAMPSNMMLLMPRPDEAGIRAGPSPPAFFPSFDSRASFNNSSAFTKECPARW